MQKEDYGVECKICVLALLAVKVLRPAVGEALHHLPLESRDAGALQGDCDLLVPESFRSRFL